MNLDEIPFNKDTFRLLKNITQDPSGEFYLNHAKDFEEQVEEPLQNLLQQVMVELPAEVVAQLEIQRNVFQRCLTTTSQEPYIYQATVYLKNEMRGPVLFLGLQVKGIEYGVRMCVEDRLENLRLNQRLSFITENVLSAHLQDRFYRWLDKPKGKFQFEEKITAAKLKKLSYQEIVAVIREQFLQLFPLLQLSYSPSEIKERGDFELTAIAKQLFLPEYQLAQWLRILKRKQQVILHGPPGTGKTFMAKKVASFLAKTTGGFCQVIQFHPAYSYEDFIQGIRPQVKDNGELIYTMTPGIFLEFCEKAKKSPGFCILVVDEINRAALSQVLGELMYLLEYREESIQLLGGSFFQIPKNVYILATMNTADRSIAIVDQALRRRFAFIPIEPNYEIIREYHGNSRWVKGLIQVLKKINQQIADPSYFLGISFFLQEDLPNSLEDIWVTEIEPYLEEYFFDQVEQVEKFRFTQIQQFLA